MESTDRVDLDARSWCINGKRVSTGVVSGGKESASVLKVHGPHHRSYIVTIPTYVPASDSAPGQWAGTALDKTKLPHDGSHSGVIADGSPLGHIRKSRTRSKPVPLSLADQRCQPIVHKVHPVFTLNPQQHGTKGSLLQMNETLLAHALSLRYDRVKEAHGSVLPHRTLSRGLSICSGLAHLHIARSSCGGP